jgi:hypothetical protein
MTGVIASPSFELMVFYFHRYIAQLRLLAANYHSLPIDLRRQMAKAPFLMALRKSKRSKQEGSATETDGDDQLQVEFTLASASDVAIVDDPYLARVFSEDFLSAPEVNLIDHRRIILLSLIPPFYIGNASRRFLRAGRSQSTQFFRQGRVQSHWSQQRHHRAC